MLWDLTTFIDTVKYITVIEQAEAATRLIDKVLFGGPLLASADLRSKMLAMRAMRDAERKHVASVLAIWLGALLCMTEVALPDLKADLGQRCYDVIECYIQLRVADFVPLSLSKVCFEHVATLFPSDPSFLNLSFESVDFQTGWICFPRFEGLALTQLN